MYDSQSAFKFLWRLHYHTGCSYQVYKVVLTVVLIQPSAVQAKWFKNKLQQQQVKEKEKKRRVYVKPWLKRRKNWELYGTLLAELRLEEEYNYNILLRMTSENFEEIFQLIKNNIPKDNTNLRELILPKL